MTKMMLDTPYIQKIMIKNAGHLPWVEEPKKVKELIKDFEKSV